MELSLRGKVAMVGGASRGLGYAISHCLAAEGASVSLAARGSGVIEAAEKIKRQTGAAVLATEADLTQASMSADWVRCTVSEFGGVDLLCVNSGGPVPGQFADLEDEAWAAAFDLLLLSAVRQVRNVLPSMRARGGGSILLLTSSAVKEPLPNLILSNVIRASVAALSKSLALELATDNIRVNQLVPGRILTERVTFMDRANADRQGITIDEQRRRSWATIPLGRYGDPHELARAAAFLLSDAASYITGATLQVDGGMLRGAY